jgi:hypothetical protein
MGTANGSWPTCGSGDRKKPKVEGVVVEHTVQQ